MIRQRGAVAVETALAMAIFVLLVILVVEFGRLMYTWVAAGEAARLGARVAVVCDTGSPAPRQRMVSLLPALRSARIDVDYTATHAVVTVSELVVRTAIPVQGLLEAGFGSSNVAFYLPSIRASLPTEALSSADNALCNP
jgi:Flp pilus assembly protein TadG